MGDLFPQALERLERHFGYQAFRAPQERVIRSVLAGHDTLAILPTGAGKSVCFQIPALVLDGLTVVISPLLALMQDQVAAARSRGIPARALNSQLSPAQLTEVHRELAAGQIKLLYVAPERAGRLVKELTEAGRRVDLLAVDEAHCIAEWGPDFRPAYLEIGALRAALDRPQTLALTGSATPGVRATILASLDLGRSGRPCDVHVASFDRRNLWFGVIPVSGDRHRLTTLFDLVRRGGPLSIVYGPTRNMVEALARVLRGRGVHAVAYHAGLEGARRRTLLDDFLADRFETVVATCAFGMGIDKPNVRLVLHWNMPATPESYYQEAGRAGRDGRPARCILLYHAHDGARARRELDVRFPDRRQLERWWSSQQAVASLPTNVAATAARLREEFRGGAHPEWWKALARRRQAAADRIEAVERYARTSACRRRSLLQYFGETGVRCAGCDRCDRPKPGRRN